MATSFGPWSYHWEGAPRPFVHPVRTPAGRVVSVDAPDDHPWQHALWFTIKFVNGENFWEEYDEFGTLRQAAPPSLTEHGDGSIEAVSTIDWIRPDGETTVASHSLSLTHRPSPSASVLDWDVRFVPTVEVELDRTPYTTWGGYGGLTLRGRPDWHDTRLRLSTRGSAGGDDGADAVETTGEGEQVLGVRASWCALDGPLADDDGGGRGGGADHEVGIVMYDHPANPGHPVPWYASTRQPAYGLDGWTNFVNAAFLWDGPQRLAGGEELRLRYRFVAHDGAWDRDRIEMEATDWLGPSRPAGRTEESA